MGCGLRVLRSARGTWLQRGRGSDRHRLPRAAPPRASFLSFHLLGVSWWLSLLPASCSFIWNPFSGTWLVALKWHRLNRRLCSATLGVRVEVRVAKERLSLAEDLCTRAARGCPRGPPCLWRSDLRPLRKEDRVCQHREVGVDRTLSQCVGPVIVPSQKQILQMLFPVIFY